MEFKVYSGAERKKQRNKTRRNMMTRQGEASHPCVAKFAPCAYEIRKHHPIRRVLGERSFRDDKDHVATSCEEEMKWKYTTAVRHIGME